MTKRFRTLVISFLGAVGTMLSVQTANADLVLSATALPSGGFSSFTITFDDTNANGKLDLSEITAFSGLTFFPIGLVTTVVTVPDIPNIADASDSAATDVWKFSGSGAFGTAGVAPWTYSITNASAVPEPGTLLLAATALGALGIARRRSPRYG
jgi:hypothetical protein